MEKEYGTQVDMWGLGCIVAELYAMMAEHRMPELDTRPLFPGKSCFPLTPCADDDTKHTREGITYSAKDQMAMIVNILGSPSKDDKSFITDPQALTYIENLPKSAQEDFQKRFPAVGEDGVDLLN